MSDLSDDDAYAADPILAGRASPEPAGGRSTAEAPEEPAAPDLGRRPWYRRTAFLLVLTAVLGSVHPLPSIVALVLLVGDQTRERRARAGGAALITWWVVTVVAFASSRSGTLPYVGFGLLAISTVSFAASARSREERSARLALGAVAAATALGAVLHLVPYGVRSTRVDDAEALRLVLEHRGEAGDSDDIDATKAFVNTGREPIWQRPYHRVLLFEAEAGTATTDNGERCFGRSQVYFLDGIDGTISSGKVLTAEELGEDDCLPMRKGQTEELLDVPG